MFYMFFKCYSMENNDSQSPINFRKPAIIKLVVSNFLCTTSDTMRIKWVFKNKTWSWK